MWLIAAAVILCLVGGLLMEAMSDLPRILGEQTERSRPAVRSWVHGFAIAACCGIVLWAIYHCVVSLRFSS